MMFHRVRRHGIRPPAGRSLVLGLTIASWLAAPAGALGAQSLLDRPPNLTGTWVGSPGTIYFDFIHRFASTGGAAEKVVNSPTFLLSVPLPGHTMVGARYGTSSVLVPGYPNEWEFFGRFAPLRQDAGAPVDVTMHGAYNQPARSWDGELTVARNFGPLRLLAAGRGFSNFRREDARWAIAGGATLRLHRFIALAGDVATLLDAADDEDLAWGAGVQLAIPYTPHTLSINLSNTTTTTLAGSSIATREGRRWGFQFVVPFTLSRYFGGGGGNAASESEPAPGAVAEPAAGQALTADASAVAAPAAEVTMSNQLGFSPAVVRIKAGESVRWRNTSDIVHTVTADPSKAAKAENVRLPQGAPRFHSGDIKPGGQYTRTFAVAGEYAYICQPHELAGMVAKVIVEPKEGQ